jgi:TetR/AcrR family transcriptional regulator
MKLTHSQISIIKAGFKVFGEHGKVKASMANIAKIAGVSKPLLFHHFGNKDKLYRGCVQYANQLLESIHRSLSQGSSIISQLKDIQIAKFDLEKNNPGIFKFILLEQTQIPTIPPTPFTKADLRKINSSINPDQYWRILYYLALGYQSALTSNKNADVLIEDYQRSFAFLEKLAIAKEE